MTSQGLSKRSEQKEETRRRVREAALELFSTAGFDATTTKAIAERAGVAAGTVFVHARDKVDLLNLVMHDRLAEATTAAFDSLPKDAPLLEQLLHVFGEVLAMYGRAPKLAAPFVKNLPGADGPNGERVTALTFAFVERLASLVEGAQARGEVAADVPPRLVAQNAFALYFFALMTWLSGLASLQSAHRPLLEQSLALQLRGLGPPAARPDGTR
jgi:AcrR family transcriptional regulator